MLVYADDVMIVGPTDLIEKVFGIYTSIWDVKVTGILVADGTTTNHAVSDLRFLGCSLERYEHMYTVDQISYIEERLLERGFDKVAGRRNLPDPQEGRSCPVDRNTSEYSQDLLKCQEEVGVLNWIALRTRPDVSCIVSICASLMTVNPLDTLHLIRGVGRYLSATKK